MTLPIAKLIVACLPDWECEIAKWPLGAGEHIVLAEHRATGTRVALMDGETWEIEVAERMAKDRAAQSPASTLQSLLRGAPSS